MQNKYEELRKKCYSIIFPDGIPLEVDCEIILTFGKTFDKDRKRTALLVTERYDSMRISRGEEKLTTLTAYKENIKENLGKPLSLQSYLLALSEEMGDELIDFKIWFEDGSASAVLPNRDKDFKFNFRKPISEQSEETLSKLIDLLS